MNNSARSQKLLKSFSTPSKSRYFSKAASPLCKSISESELKSMELQAISLIDSDLTASKQLIERCLRLFDEQKFPILENIYLHYLHCDVCTRCGQIELAISSGEKALKLISNCGSGSLTLGYEARTLQILGILYSNISEYSKGAYMFQKLLAILQDYEVPSISYALVKEKIIDCLLQSNKHNIAKPHILDLLSIQRTFPILIQYAKVHIFNKEYQEAEGILTEAIALVEGDDLEKYKVLTKLALCEISLEKHSEAAIHLSQCAEIIKSTGMATNSEVLWVFSSLGQIHYTQNRYEAALSVLQTSKVLAEELQLKDTEYGNTLTLIGKIKLKQNNRQEALLYLSSARKILESLKKESALEAVLAILELYLADGNSLKTWELLQEIEGNPYSPYASAMAANEMGNLLREFGYGSQAMRFYESSLQKYRILKGESSLECGRLHLNIGALLMQQGKYVQAHEHLNLSMEIKSEIFGENHKELAGVYEELSRCLGLMGKRSYARDLFEKARKIYNS